ncbi:MAG TPA: hypothetical protein VK009_18000, partial [Chloroflexota bacterium]|nr:hypothetical protein [Chloroflexota bacterium]
MSDYELIDGAGEHDSVRVTVTTIEMPAQVARGLTNADDVRRAVAPFVTGDAVAFSPSERPHPVRDTLRHWSPFRPFAGMLANYRLARAALGTSGKLGILYICVAAGLASVVWRHASIPIGIAGGLLVSVILFVRT